MRILDRRYEVGNEGNKYVKHNSKKGWQKQPALTNTVMPGYIIAIWWRSRIIRMQPVVFSEHPAIDLD